MAFGANPTLSLIPRSAQSLSARLGKWGNNSTKQVRTQNYGLGCHQLCN